MPASPPFTATGHPDYAATPPTNSSLRPFFDQAVYGTRSSTTPSTSISSDARQWWLPEPKEKKKSNTFPPSTSIAKATSSFPSPSRSSSTTAPASASAGTDRPLDEFTYTRNAKVVSAEIDPDHTILLDTNLFNNSYTTTSNPIPARKLTNLWLSFNQLVAQLVAWIV